MKFLHASTFCPLFYCLFLIDLLDLYISHVNLFIVFPLVISIFVGHLFILQCLTIAFHVLMQIYIVINYK